MNVKPILLAGGAGAAAGLLPKLADVAEYKPYLGSAELAGGVLIAGKQPALAAGMIALGARDLAEWIYDWWYAPSEEPPPDEAAGYHDAGATYFPPSYYDAGNLLSSAPDAGGLMASAPDAGAAFQAPRRRSFLMRPAT